MITRLLLILGSVCTVLTADLQAQVNGCTDPAANNFNASATVNDGSCTYNATTLTAQLKFTPSITLAENSGLIFWNNKLWTFNDGGNAPNLYELDTTGAINRTISFAVGTNVDWEDIAQDDNYVYVGDFGNNSSGNRQDLKVYRVAKSDLLSGTTVTPDSIEFNYSDQTNFTAVAGNTSDFDCEAMIVMNGKIYLFTKQWTSNGTSVYEIPAVPGPKYSAPKLNTYNVQGLITGADVLPDKNIIILCGYTSALNRFLFMMYDFQGTNFFSGNKRKITISQQGQTEGIAFRNPEYIYISRERFTTTFLGFPVTITQAVESVNLTALLSPYYTILLPIEQIDLGAKFMGDRVNLTWDIQPASEFSTGEIQRRTGTDPRYKMLTGINTAKGTYTDYEPAHETGNIYYRIKAMDKDARPSYSKEKKVTINAKPSASMHFNSPYLYVNFPSGRSYQLELYNMAGALVYKEASMQPGKFDFSARPSGQYIAVLRTDGTIANKLTLFK